VNSNDFGGGGGGKGKGKGEGKKVDPFSHLNEDPVPVPVQKQMKAPSMGLGKDFLWSKLLGGQNPMMGGMGPMGQMNPNPMMGHQRPMMGGMGAGHMNPNPIMGAGPMHQQSDRNMVDLTAGFHGLDLTGKPHTQPQLQQARV
jgi:hypothetical protein